MVTVVYGIGAVALVAMLVVARAANEDTSLAVAEECPLGFDDCAVTTTTIDDAVTTTTAVPTGELLSMSSGTLRLDVWIERTELVTAEILRMHVRAVDTVPNAVIVGGAGYGDGLGGSRASMPILECVGPLLTTTAPLPSSEMSWTHEYSYRQPGRYTLVVDVVSVSCRDEHKGPGDSEEPIDGDPYGRRATVRATLNVAKSVLLKNGPLRPVPSIDQLPSLEDATVVMVNVGARDKDGFVRRIELNWGDGSAPFVKERSLAKCVDPQTRWPGPTEIIEAPTHRYPESGPYTATLTVVSVGCDGSGTQTEAATLTLTAP